MEQQKIIPIILSGGLGRRLWPLSRTLYPKQLQPLVSEKSLLQETAIRSSGEIFEPPLVICNEEHRFIVAEQFREIEIIPRTLVLEPVGRNTAPAAAVAAVLSEEFYNDALLLILPSDHAIKEKGKFLEVILTGKNAARNGKLVTFGTIMSRAETGYGYIKTGKEIIEDSGCYEVSEFIEKPNEKLAKDFFKSGSYYWNSGIFLFSAVAYLNELNNFYPDIVRLGRVAVQNKLSDLDFIRLEKKAFEKIETISIDRAVMEKSKNVAMVPANMGWNDVGSWAALWEISDRDENDNVKIGQVITKNVKKSYIRSEKKLVAALGIKDVIVVNTEDAVLVAGKDYAEEVKDLVDKLNEGTTDVLFSHSKMFRPWGWYQSLEVGVGFQVKLIYLKPGGKISLQRHKHRAEHWVVVAGIATVTHGEHITELQENESTFISAGEKHRLENKTKLPLKVIEVQSGAYLGEDDIERLDDYYGRT